MEEICKLLAQITSEEQQLLSSQFLAPCPAGGRVRVRVCGLVYTFAAEPKQFAGWGIFEPTDVQTAQVVEEADVSAIDRYLQHFEQFRLRLAYPLRGQTWLAYPANEGDFRQRLGAVKPVPVHLVSEGVTFEQILARWDGCAWWFEAVDRRADPLVIEELQSALHQLIPPEALRFRGMTPEMRGVYDLVTQQTEGFSQQHRDERRLRTALQLGGGELQQFSDRGDYWHLEWTTTDGQRHTSAIAKGDLTVMSAGICLSGRDCDFDLQSLVGVVEGWNSG